MLGALIGFVLRLASSGILDKALTALKAEADNETERQQAHRLGGPSSRSRRSSAAGRRSATCSWPSRAGW
ncbi:MAG: hypothetical protein WDM84_07595 [Bauldia sp.]